MCLESAVMFDVQLATDHALSGTASTRSVEETRGTVESIESFIENKQCPSHHYGTTKHAALKGHVRKETFGAHQRKN